jgi:hypothetical protein
MTGKRIKVTDNFFLDEFIDPLTYNDLDNGLSKIDKRLFQIAQFIRIKTGKSVTINNWFTGGQFKESGLRRSNTTTGQPLSMHKIGKAIDLKIAGWNGKMWRVFIEANAADLFALGVRRIEDDKLATTWLHIDLKEHTLGKFIRVIDLTKQTALIKAH